MLEKERVVILNKVHLNTAQETRETADVSGRAVQAEGTAPAETPDLVVCIATQLLASADSALFHS